MPRFAELLQRFLVVVLVGAIVLPSPICEARSKAEKRSKSKLVAGSQLEGRVLGPDGKGRSGAVVVVESLDGDVSWSSEESDARGRFHLEGLPYGWADLTVKTDQGEFLGDQAINLPPGTKVIVNFNLLETADKPASWWTDRRVELPAGVSAEQVAGMAQSSQRLTGVEYWKSPAGIAILVSVSVLVLAFIAGGGSGYDTPSTNP